MSKSITYFILINIIGLQLILAQPNKRTNYWYFSNNVGLDFNSGEPVEDPHGTVFEPYDGASTVMSDTHGNLLFYCDHSYIRNKDHLPMKNDFGYSQLTVAYQGTIAIPKPGNENQYYVFMTSTSRLSTGPPLFYYCIDMTLDNGLGEVIEIDTLVTAWDAAEKITATYHKNKQDVWVVVRKYFDDSFASYKVTEAGVNPLPVLSPAPHRELFWGATNWGTMKISYDKKYLVSTFMGDDSQSGGSVEICSFDNQTGIVTYLYTIKVRYSLFPNSVPYEESSCEFSPCSKYLYVAAEDQRFQYSESHIIQFDMQYILDSALFSQSSILIGEVQGSNLQLASDGRIYCLGKAAMITPNNPLNNYLGVINSPGSNGISCSYDSSLLYFQNGQVSYGMINFFNDYLHRFDFAQSQAFSEKRS